MVKTIVVNSHYLHPKSFFLKSADNSFSLFACYFIGFANILSEAGGASLFYVLLTNEKE
jgi:hypothetical protein